MRGDEVPWASLAFFFLSCVGMHFSFTYAAARATLCVRA